MKSFIIYTANGKILRTGYCPDTMLDDQAQPGELMLEGEAKFGADYIDNGVVTPIPPKPDGAYDFDYESKTWVFDEPKAIEAAYFRRNQLLKDGPDRVNPMWWASMSTADQTAVAEYRQALLDITNQTGYPINIEWPDIPLVLKG